MSQALCIKCAKGKVGAVTPCPSCGFVPVLNQDIAKSLFLTDHFKTPTELVELQNEFFASGVFQYDQDKVSEIEKEIRDNHDLLKMPIGCHILVWTPFVIMVILIITLIALFIYVKA